jgi:hypothetical protein
LCGSFGARARQALTQALQVVAENLIRGAALFQQSPEGDQFGVAIVGERINDALAVAAVGDQVGVSKDGEVAGDGVLGQTEHGLKITDADVAVAEEVKEAEAGGLGGGLQDAGEV